MTTHPKTELLGAHMSIAGGFVNALERGESINCTAIQIFTKSNRQWQAKPISDEEAEKFHTHLKKSPIKVVVAHAMYLLNLGSPDSKTWHASTHALRIELERCNTLGIPYLVVHPGARLTSPMQDCLSRIAQAINHVFEKEGGKTMLLLENMAGQGSSICSTFEELAQVIDQVDNKKRVGVCIDTCHAFAAGYDLRTEETYKDFWKKFDDTLGIHRLKAMHLNDSKKELGSRVDRHEEIGHGQLTEEAFSLIMNDIRLAEVPKILETPKDDLVHYEKNMKLLLSLITEKNKKNLNL